MKRIALLAALAAVVAGILSTRQSSDLDAQAAVRHAFARTTETGSSRFEMTFGSSRPLPAMTHPTGAMDYVHHRGHVEYGRWMQMLFDGDVTYATWPMPWREKTPWLRYEAGSQEEDPFDLQQRMMENPARLLVFLTSASNGIRTVGVEEVRDTRTTHYEGTLDFQRIVDNAPPAERADLQSMLDFLRDGQPTTTPFGLWADDDGVARRVRLELGEGWSITTEYYDFGVPVHITPPRADELLSPEEFWKEMTEHEHDSGCTDGSGGVSESSDDGGTGDLDGTITVCVKSASLNESHSDPPGP